jgi:hypothetical protein
MSSSQDCFARWSPPRTAEHPLYRRRRPDRALLAGAILTDMHDEWQSSERRYLSEGSMAQLNPTSDTGGIAAMRHHPPGEEPVLDGVDTALTAEPRRRANE